MTAYQHYYLYSIILSVASVQLFAQLFTHKLAMEIKNHVQTWNLLVDPTKYRKVYTQVSLIVFTGMCFIPHINLAVAVAVPLWFYATYAYERDVMEATTVGSAHDARLDHLLAGHDQPAKYEGNNTIVLYSTAK